MRLYASLILFFLMSLLHAALIPFEPDKPVMQAIWDRAVTIWYDGNTDLYLTGYAWHNRYTYTSFNRQNKRYNEISSGGGMGKSIVDKDGDWHAFYAMGFSDSHYTFQPLVGYGFQKMVGRLDQLHMGFGFTWFITERQDIFDGIPFLGFPLPMVSAGLARGSIYATYVPGGRNFGNVLFIFGRWMLE